MITFMIKKLINTINSYALKKGYWWRMIQFDNQDINYDYGDI